MFKQPTVGEIEMVCRDKRTGKVLWRAAARNTMTYDGVDLIARMLAWEDVRINMAYIEFAAGDMGHAAADPVYGRDYYKAIDADAQRTSDYLRVAIVTPPHTETDPDEDRFDGNKVVFNVFSAGERGINKMPFNATMSVFGLALVYAPDVADRTQDVVFARTYAFEPKPKVDGSQIALRWTHTVGHASEE